MNPALIYLTLMVLAFSCGGTPEPPIPTNTPPIYQRSARHHSSRRYPSPRPALPRGILATAKRRIRL